MRSRGFAVAAGVLLVAGAAAAKSVVVPTQDAKWTPGAIPQVSMAAVDGDPAKGASHFFLKYAAGFVTPAHHHSLTPSRRYSCLEAAALQHLASA